MPGDQVPGQQQNSLENMTRQDISVQISDLQSLLKIQQGQVKNEDISVDNLKKAKSTAEAILMGVRVLLDQKGIR